MGAFLRLSWTEIRSALSERSSRYLRWTAAVLGRTESDDREHANAEPVRLTRGKAGKAPGEPFAGFPATLAAWRRSGHALVPVMQAADQWDGHDAPGPRGCTMRGWGLLSPRAWCGRARL